MTLGTHDFINALSCSSARQPGNGTDPGRLPAPDAAPESTPAVATPSTIVTASPDNTQAVVSPTPAVAHGETLTPVPADQELVAVIPAPVLVNPAGFRVLTQTDAFNVNKPADERANGRDEAGDRLGAALVSADFNGDGYDDLAVGATGEAPAGDPAYRRSLPMAGVWRRTVARKI